jgi:hypothetical protein
MKNNTNGNKPERLVLKTVFAFVTQQPNGKHIGIAVADNFLGGGKQRSFSLTAETGPHAIMESGARKPQFAETLISRLAMRTDGVVLEVYRTENGVYRVKSWGFQSDWDAMLETIKLGGRDHMSRSERFMARFTKCGQAVVAGMQKSVTAMAPSQKPKSREFKSFDALARASFN